MQPKPGSVWTMKNTELRAIVIDADARILHGGEAVLCQVGDTKMAIPHDKWNDSFIEDPQAAGEAECLIGYSVLCETVMRHDGTIADLVKLNNANAEKLHKIEKTMREFTHAMRQYFRE